MNLLFGTIVVIITVWTKKTSLYAFIRMVYVSPVAEAVRFLPVIQTYLSAVSPRETGRSKGGSTRSALIREQ